MQLVSKLYGFQKRSTMVAESEEMPTYIKIYLAEKAKANA